MTGMNDSRSIPMQAHLITPDEPRTGRDIGIGSKNEKAQHRHSNIRKTDPERLHVDDGHDSDNLGDSNKKNQVADKFMASVRNTRDLEIEISIAIQHLKDPNNDNDVDRRHIVDLLNRSLMAISHWSFQAQLDQLRKTDDDRHVVENHLLKREMEVLMNRRSSNPDDQSLSMSTASKGHPLSSPSSSSPSSSPSSKNAISGPVSPTTPPKKMVALPSKRHSVASMTPRGNVVDPASLKLVESKKPHPRMRRTSDNPMTNDYVRVFHLERK